MIVVQMIMLSLILLSSFTILIVVLSAFRLLTTLTRQPDGTMLGAAPPVVAKGIDIGTQAPAFTLPQVGGGMCALRDYQGQHVLLTFVHPRSETCKQFLVYLNAIADLKEPIRYSVLVISSEGVDENVRLAMDYDLAIPLLIQEGNAISRLYNVNAVPYVYVIDEEQIIRSHGYATNTEDIWNILSSLQRDRVTVL